MTITLEQPKVISAVSQQVETLTKRFACMTPGDVAEYDELEKLVRCTRDSTQFSSYIQSAKRRTLTRHGIVLGTIRGVGVKSLLVEEIAELPEHHRKKIRRQTALHIKKLRKGLDMDGDDTDKRAIQQGIYQAMMVQYATSTKTVRKIEQTQNVDEGIVAMMKNFKMK